MRDIILVAGLIMAVGGLCLSIYNIFADRREKE